MPYFAVIDTETNWMDQVMSIGTVIADAGTFRPVAAKYHILPAYCEAGGMYYDALFLETPVKPICCTRQPPKAGLYAAQVVSAGLLWYGVLRKDVKT